MWKDMASTHAKLLLTGLHRQWKEEKYMDAKITMHNTEIKCHACVVQITSKYIKSLLLKSGEISIQNYQEHSHINTLISKLYSCESVSLDVLKSQITPIAKHLKIEIFTGAFGKMKNTIKLNQALNENWIKAFHNGMCDIRKSGEFSDVKLKVDGSVFHCHKAVLAAMSPYFDTMFHSGMKEAIGNETNLHGLDKHLMAKVLDHIYTGANIVTIDNIESALSASVYLQVHSLQHDCEKFLIHHLDPENCVGVLRLAESYSIDELYTRVTAFILRRFEDVGKTHDFLSLSKCKLIAFIKDNNLNVSDETKVLEIVIQWFDSNLERDTNDLIEILKHVRLTAMSDIDLDSLVSSNIKCRNSREFKDNLKRAMATISDGRKDIQSRHQEVLVLIKASSEQKGIYVNCYSFLSKQWYELQPMVTYKAGCSYAACGLDNEIYLSGGSGTPSGFICYKGGTNEWIQMENLAEGRSDHMTVGTNGSVYVLGGSKPLLMEIMSDISRYIISEKVWRQEGQLFVPVSNAACTVSDKRILVYGGNMSFVQHSNHIQCFDTTTKSSCVISRLPMICSFTGITQHDNAIYIVCPEGQIIRHSFNENAEVIGKVHNHCIVGFGVAIHNNKIIVLGGSSAKFESDETESFDLETRKASKYVSLKLPWKKQSNQYFGIFMWISKAHLSKFIS